MENKPAHIIRKFIDFLKRHLSRKHEDLPFYILIILALVVFVVALNLFVELTDELMEQGLEIYDNAITEYVISFRTPALNNFFRAITDLGDFYAYLVGTAIVAIYLFVKFRHWKFTLQLVGITILSALSNVMLKRFIDRARPGIEHLVSAEGLSYPSGHSMSAMAFYGFLIYLSFHIKMSKWLRGLLCFFFALLILLIGLSRIYLGVHFPTDVAGGFIAGMIWLAFCIVLFNATNLFLRKKARKNSLKKEEN